MYDSKYDSKMHDITIPLMGFNSFHHSGNSEFRKDFEGFIGRKSIIDKLRSWLEDNDPDNDQEDSVDRSKPYSRKYSGAYLITGFRGMGKSAFVHKTIREIKEDAQKNRKQSCYYVPISINVGNDLLTSKELLYIICKLLSASFEEKTRWWHNKRSIKNLLQVQIPCLILGLGLIATSFFTFEWNQSSLWTNITGLLSNRFFISGTLVLAICCLMRYIFYYIWKRTDRTFFITTWQIKKVFKHLNERIDSEMIISSDHEVKSGSNVSSDNNAPNIGYTFKRRKENKYPIAQTTEIQDLLVSQLHLIRRLKYAKFRFIFVIDELDKICPEDEETQVIPEYNSANIVNGNSTYNSRQRAFVSLLANMKYFISSSEAKFVFITGYDMYEATLADIANREFNIHSIFNGYINVSSFLRKTGKSKGADSMIEKYFCHLLLDKPEKPELKCNDLGDYANYFREKWETIGDLRDNRLGQLELLLDRRITFLRHFLTYLFYMSNGSPKKLAIYLEKYIRSKERTEAHYTNELDKSGISDNDIDDITLGVKNDWEKCDFFLYFDVRNIKKIEFINYLIYPMLKNLIAKSSVYNDKLLVSTSFMISNLYKFHKSGFSWRNLEYMPELLDINKTPELRDFIGGIMQFLNQTHIDEAAINLYKFKFPLRLSEEISYFSKTAEEITYLFNFSHDELLSIKKLYYQQLQHYSDSKYESPALASIHHMLGDIYMLEENYEQAIFEFNEALNAISRQDIDDPKNIEDSSNLLFRIRVSLKLGLAYEKRKTFDTAYITYENLVTLIMSVAKNALLIGQSERKRSFLIETIAYQQSCSSFFSNIRLTYLGILAKAAVLEKMDLGGITDIDLIRLHAEFEPIVHKLEREIRTVVITDFYTKLGVILFYKNGYYSCNNNNDFIKKLSEFRIRLELGEALSNNKVDKCEEFLKNKIMHGNRVNAPCMACQYFNASIKNCMENLDVAHKEYYNKSRSIFFIEHLFNSDLNQEIIKKGHVFLLTMANVLIGMGNTLLGCIKGIDDPGIYDFFSALNDIFKISLVKPEVQEITKLENLDINHYAKSILYYLAAAKTYELLTDYKSAYNIYVQILDAVWVFHKAAPKAVSSGDRTHKGITDEALDFCERVTERAIECTYLHYGSINCAEIETQKHEIAKKPVEHIHLHALSNYPEIEVIIEKYYQLSLFASNESKCIHVIKTVLNSRQMGSNKLIATLTQNVQNLFFKVLVNEAILLRIMPELYQLLERSEHDVVKSLRYILDYYNSDAQETIKLCHSLNLQLSKESDDDHEVKFVLLDYLLNDSLFCLNKIAELLAPLFSTTLYNNAFRGEIYEKAYNWSDILTCVREVFDYTEAGNKDVFIAGFEERYSNKKEINPQESEAIRRMFNECSIKLSATSFWDSYPENNKSRVDTLYEKVYSESNNYHTSSYLLGYAIDYFNRAIEMHSSGKTYKEMMPMLFFLEDDLHNDSSYMNLATERFLLNHNYVQDKLVELRKYSFAKITKSRLLQIDKYFE